NEERGDHPGDRDRARRVALAQGLPLDGVEGPGEDAADDEQVAEERERARLEGAAGDQPDADDRERDPEALADRERLAQEPAREQRRRGRDAADDERRARGGRPEERHVLERVVGGDPDQPEDEEPRPERDREAIALAPRERQQYERGEKEPQGGERERPDVLDDELRRDEGRAPDCSRSREQREG